MRAREGEGRTKAEEEEKEKRSRREPPRSESVRSVAGGNGGNGGDPSLSLFQALSPTLSCSLSIARESPSLALALPDSSSNTANAPEGSRTAVTAVDVEPLIDFDEKKRKGGAREKKKSRES